ncbi:MAG: paraquat-inducible protein A [Gemmobacter sp.]|uniref:paraquat-inducible protein A n=1 Tax=Gemmobacter sp. TaxID=1898957 RepID=UPI00391C9C5B
MTLSDRLALALTLLLAVAFPVAWFAPLMTVRLRLAFWAEGTDVSLISTLQALWSDDPGLALVLSFLALAAPMLKLLGAALILLGALTPRAEGALWLLGRLAMADVFLIAVYIALFKGLDAATIRPGWGLWAYTGAVLASLALSSWLARREAGLRGAGRNGTRGA